MAEVSEPIAPSPVGKALALSLGLLLIVSANFVLRKKLEHTPLPDYPMFHAFPDIPGWKLLLPLDWGEATGDSNLNGTVHWCTTGLVVLQMLVQHFSLTNVFYALNAALIVASFALSWSMFRSAIFSFTLTLCMAFGTQFHWAYACSPVILLYLFVIYLEANLLCFVKLLQTGGRGWRIAFPLTLIPVALCTELWVDYLAFLTLGSLFLFAYAWRTQDTDLKRRAGFALLASWVVAGIYLAIRVSFGRQQYQLGNESEMIFTYSSPILGIEDFLSNVMTYLYIAISNYFPPFMVSSNSLYYFGAQEIIAQQHGYHEAKTHLAAEHHLFYWYFWAGIVFAVFVYFLIRNAKIALQQKSLPHVYLTMTMLMIVCGFAIHTLVKYRPYLSVPLLSYKCMVSNLGVALLLAYGLMHARRIVPLPRVVYPLLIVLAWGIIGYGALTRPAYLTHLSSQVGMGGMPDPRRNLRTPRFLRSARPTSTAQSGEPGK